MKKIILILILGILTLSSCSKEETTAVIEKKDFYIDIKKAWELDNIAYLKKTWKIDSTQNIVLNSNANGRVKIINVKSWDNVLEWQVLAVLEDNIANYNLNLEVASNNLDASKNNLEVVKNNLEVIKNNLEKSKLNYESTKIKLDKSISDIQRNLNNLSIDDNSTSTSIEINKIDNSISKLKLDYDNLLLSNNETLSGFSRTLSKEFITLTNFIDDIVYFSDEILWVTYSNRDKNDSYEVFLWAKDSPQKLISEKKLLKLIDLRNKTLNSENIKTIELSDYNNQITTISDSYSQIIDFLNSFDVTMWNTISSVWSISDTQISAYKSAISWYKSLYNWYNSSFLVYSNSIYSFLETYKNNQASVIKQIENLEKDKNIYLKSLDLNKISSKSTLEEAISNRDITLKNLDLVIVDSNSSIRDAEIRVRDAEIRVRDAEINYKKASNEASKLFIKSPINWIVWDILIDKWQEIFSWAAAFNILSEWTKEVTISFNKDELDFVSEWMKALYKNWEKTFTWTIYSISKNADSNLKYSAKVNISSDSSSIWNILNLDIPITLNNKLIPVNAIKVSSLWIWTINYFSTWSTIEQLDLKVWNIYWDEIEVIWKIDNNLDIILNYVDNYDAEKFILKTK